LTFNTVACYVRYVAGHKFVKGPWEPGAVNGMRIGEKVRVLRESRRVSGQELADRLGMNPVTLSQYERGTRAFPYDLVEQIADVFGIEVTLFNADEPWATMERAQLEYTKAIDAVYAILGQIGAPERVTVVGQPSADDSPGGYRGKPARLSPGPEHIVPIDARWLSVRGQTALAVRP
jgi:transcriptional regulator with XRE-family HTH domain